MAKKYELKGMREVVARLNKEAKRIKSNSAKGLIEAAIVIRRDMDKTPPKIPIDTGNLRSSWFVTTARTTPRGKSASFKGSDASKMSSQHSLIVFEAKATASASRKPLVVMGFSANYTTKVHEDMESRFKRPGSGPKFFEASLRRNEKEVIKILQENTEIR